MSLSHIIQGTTTSGSLGLPVQVITPPGVYSNGYILPNSTVLSSATALTPTAAQLPACIMYTASGSTATFTPPTAQAMYNYVASIGVQPSIGSSFSFQIDNQNSGNLTLSTSTGVTYVASTTQATVTKKIYVWRFSAVAPVSGSTAVIY